MASIRVPLLLLAAVFAVVFVWSAEAQPSTPSCAQKMVPCVAYMDSTKPPDACCNPLKEAVITELACLCNLYTSPGLLESFGINRTQAFHVTQACGVKTDSDICKESAPSPTAGSPPAVPVPESGGDNDAGRMIWSGLPGLLLVWASMLLH